MTRLTTDTQIWVESVAEFRRASYIQGGKLQVVSFDFCSFFRKTPKFKVIFNQPKDFKVGNDCMYMYLKFQ